MAASTAALTGSRPRSDIGSSTRVGARARADSLATGKRGPPAPGSAPWRARLPPAATRRPWSHAREATSTPSPECTWATARVVGDADALAILDQYADYVAIGFAGLANILDPEVIVVSGGLINLGDVLIERIRARFPQHLEAPDYRPEIPIVAATLGEQAGVIGAAVLARELLA